MHLLLHVINFPNSWTSLELKEFHIFIALQIWVKWSVTKHCRGLIFGIRYTLPAIGIRNLEWQGITFFIAFSTLKNRIWREKGRGQEQESVETIYFLHLKRKMLLFESNYLSVSSLAFIYFLQWWRPLCRNVPFLRNSLLSLFGILFKENGRAFWELAGFLFRGYDRGFYTVVLSLWVSQYLFLPENKYEQRLGT
jgi:hypothetical protein